MNNSDKPVKIEPHKIEADHSGQPASPSKPGLIDLASAEALHVTRNLRDGGHAVHSGLGGRSLEWPSLTAAQLKELALRETSPASDWDAKHAALVDKAAKTHAQLQFFGDSITEFIGDPGNINAFNAHFGALKPTNFGIAGDTTAGLFRRVNDGELGGHPKAVVLLIGTNDVPTPKSADSIAQDIAKIVETIRLHEPKTKVLVMGLLPRGGPDDPSTAADLAKIKQVNAEISHLDNGHTVRFVDIGGKFKDVHGHARADLLPDYLHPNFAGYQVWSDAIKPVIHKMVNERS